MANYVAVAEEFVRVYYDAFDTNRPSLQALYRDNSMLSFEANQTKGAAAIVEKLVSLPFQKVAHEKASVDAQPSNEQGGILVMVTGRLLVDEERTPMSYSQSFQLLPDGQGSYFILNDVFRLVYAAH